MKYIAYTVKGLEQVVVTELRASLKNVEILEVADKRVVFYTTNPIASLLNLKTVDDIGILIAETKQLSSKTEINDLIDIGLINDRS